MAAQTAKLFWSGRSQAVRLPKEFRFEGKEVRIRKRGDAVIIEPIADDWAWLDAIVGKLDDDVVAAVNEPVPQQERPELDKLFS
ncbi:MAG TPA: type II toxin-antitoxin system VapB family antitoxin [Stellaceae bacterium]|nr:type II toxin-antitoxin system VapB family antitoxin [Stellaceae bacterium]